MRTKIRRRGNGAAVRIPASILVAAKMQVDQTVEIRADGRTIIVESMAPPVYDLDDLLAEMKPETFPDQIDFGPHAGREVW